MICELCGCETRVADSRDAEAGRAIRRRRECTVCQHRFTTYERTTTRHANLVHAVAAAKSMIVQLETFLQETGEREAEVVCEVTGFPIQGERA